MDQREFPIFNTTTGKHTSQDVSGFRGKLLFNVTDHFDITVMAHTAKSKSKGFNFVYAYLPPSQTLLFPGSPFTQALLLPGITPSYV